MAAHDIYSAQLAHLHQGHALWCPEPWAYDEVKVGDVGYLWRGAFFRLFNATLPADDPGNARFGVPDGFVTLELPPDTTYVNDKFIDSGEDLRSTSVKKFRVSTSATGAVVPAGAGVRFECSNSHGAVLMFRRRAIREDATLRDEFKSYILAHFRSWYTFANDRHRRGIKAGQIMLVTGCDKTAEWASAVFSDKGSHAEIFFSGGMANLASGELALSGTWERTSSVQHRTGPICTDVVKFDQAVFIRGFKVRERPFLAPKVIEAAAEPKSPRPRTPESDRVQLYREHDGALDDDTNLIVESIPEDRIDFHPADAFLDYILEHSEKDIAIVHDDDWCNQTIFQPDHGVPPESVNCILESYVQKFFDEQEQPVDPTLQRHSVQWQSASVRRGRSYSWPCTNERDTSNSSKHASRSHSAQPFSRASSSTHIAHPKSQSPFEGEVTPDPASPPSSPSEPDVPLSDDWLLDWDQEIDSEEDLLAAAAFLGFPNISPPDNFLTEKDWFSFTEPESFRYHTELQNSYLNDSRGAHELRRHELQSLEFSNNNTSNHPAPSVKADKVSQAPSDKHPPVPSHIPPPPYWRTESSRRDRLQIRTPSSQPTPATVQRKPLPSESELPASLFALIQTIHSTAEGVKVYREQCENLSARCVDLILAIQESAAMVKDDYERNIIGEIEPALLSVESQLQEWSKWNKMKSILSSSRIQEGITRSHRVLDDCANKLMILSIKMSQSTAREYAVAQQQDQTELRGVLQDILKDVEVAYREQPTSQISDIEQGAGATLDKLREQNRPVYNRRSQVISTPAMVPSLPGYPSFRSGALSVDLSLSSRKPGSSPAVRVAVNGTVEAGTLEGLVDALLNDSDLRRNTDYRAVFLTTCFAHTNARRIFRMLASRFDPRLTSNLPAKDRTAIRYNVLTVMKEWLVNPFGHFDKSTLLQMNQFCKSARGSIFMTMARDIVLKIDERIAALEQTRSVTMPSPSLPTSIVKAREISPSDLGTAMTILEADVYSRILPEDYVTFLKYPRSHTTIESARMFSNKIVNWIQMAILRSNDAQTRGKTLRFFVETAAECRKRSNFASMAAIINALDSPIITRLSLTRRVLNESREGEKALQKLRALLDPTNDHEAYRAALQENRNVCIPWLVVHLRGLNTVFRKPSRIESIGEPLIDFTRCNTLFSHLQRVLQFETPKLDRGSAAHSLAYLEQQLEKRVPEKDNLEARSLHLQEEEMRFSQNRIIIQMSKLGLK